jgi:hypothetical protein
VRALHLDHGAFDDHIIDLVIILSLLSFVLKINIGASSDSMDCVMGGEIIALVRRLA